MSRNVRKPIAVALLAAALGALTVATPASAQPDPSRERGMQGMHGAMGEQGMGGMMEMMQNCPMMQRMQGGGDRHGLPRLPAGNEKLELQMHADMMRAMSDILAKYAARLPDRK